MTAGIEPGAAAHGSPPGGHDGEGESAPNATSAAVQAVDGVDEIHPSEQAGAAESGLREAPMPLDALERALAPIRRVASWTTADTASRVDGIRHFEAIGRRWLLGALRLDLPGAVREHLVTLAGLFDGYDSAARVERERRIAAIDQSIRRVDAMLGLPLPVRLVARGHGRQEAPDVEPSEESALAGGQSQGEPPARSEGPSAERSLDRRGGRPRERDKAAERAEALAAEPPGEPGVDLSAFLVDLADRNVAVAGRGDGAARRAPELRLAPQLIEALADEDILTVGQLLKIRPVAEEVLSPIHGAGREMPEGRVAVGGRVGARYTLLSPDGSRSHRLRLRGADILRARFTQAPSWEQGTDLWLETFQPDHRVVVVGALGRSVEDGLAELLDPEIAADDGQHVARMQVYGLDRVPDRAVRAAVDRCLALGDPLPGEGHPPSRFHDIVPASVLARVQWARRGDLDEAADAGAGAPSVVGGRSATDATKAAPSFVPLVPIGVALADVHRRGAARPEARARLAFDELLAVQLALSARRFSTARDRGIPHAAVHALVTRLGGGDEFLLNDDQQVAFEDIKRDLRQTVPMLRVLVGDVGVGRGAVALAAAVMVAESKSQVLFVCPDRAAAEQRFAFAEPVLREAGVAARLVDDAGKRSVRDAISRGEVQIVFGTYELLTDNLEFRRLGLVVAEEGEPWGRATTLIRALRPPRPHALVVPTTPIGAAVALTAYADHDLTVIGGRELRAVDRATPSTGKAARAGAAGDDFSEAEAITLFPEVDRRRPVEVEIVSADERNRAYAAAAEAVARGRQVLVVFPMGEDGDALSMRDALRVVRALEEEALQGSRVALYHGSLTREERHRIYDDFRHRRSDVLVATSLVEDGPAVPDASLIIVEQADRVGRSRLQRIRGFVSRSRHEAKAILVVGEMSDEGATERLRHLVRTGDGFALHEAWVARHPIESLVVEGSPPLPQLTWADLSADRELLFRAREVVHELLREDATLRKGWPADLAREARARFDDLWSSDDAEGTSWRCPIPDGSGAERRKRRRRRRKR